MNSEKGASAHDLNVSVFKVERVVTSGHLFVAATSNVVSQFGRGKVGYGGDA